MTRDDQTDFDQADFADLAPYSPAKAWWVAVLMLAALVLSYIDRYLPTLVIERIKADMELTDFQVGLMLGPAFVVLYLAFGIPLGWLADRISRRAIMAVAIIIWCLMTTMGAFVPSFPALFATRLGVGLGEAAVSPCAISLISDYFSRRSRSRAINLYQAGSIVGAGLTFLFVGPLLQWIEALPPITIPSLGTVHSWQSCFLLVGLPGVILAGLMFTFAEPQRREMIDVTGAGRAAGAASLGDTLRFMLTRWRAFGAVIVASGCNSVLGSMAYWNVALFERAWGWDTARTGVAIGSVFLTAGPLAIVSAMWLTTRLQTRAGHPDAPLRVALIGLAVGVPLFALYPLMPTPQLGLAVMFVGHFGSIIANAAGPACIPLLAPGPMRSQATAVYVMIISLTGILIGPPLIGWIADVAGGPQFLPEAISAEALLFGLPTLLIVMLGLKPFRRAVVEIEAMIVRARA